MKVIHRKSGNYLLRFTQGEHYPGTFIKFLEKEKIGGGFFVGLGGAEDPDVLFYDLKKKKYISRSFKGDFEVLNVTGNVAKKGNETIVHQHITLSGKDYRAVGGHLNKMKVGPTLEIFLQTLKPLKREKDPGTGLNLFIP